MEYILSNDEWQKCIDFVLLTANNHNAGNRTEQRKKRNMLMGKTGEFAFAHLAKQYGLELQSDLNKYDTGDTGDFIIGDKAIEIKTIKHNAQYLMLEPRKLQQHLFMSHPFPKAFVLAQNEWNFDKDQPTRKVTLQGFIYDHDLFNLQEITFFVRAGEYIPNTDTIQEKDNFVIRLDRLRKDWGVLFQFLRD